MIAALTSLETELHELIDAFDPHVVEGVDAVELLERFDRLARLASAGQAMCAARIADTGAWRRSGHRDAAGFISARTGSHRSDAKDAISIGTRLLGATEFDAAVRSGSISAAQAAEIADTLADHPDAEDELLGAAQTSTMRELRAACNEIASRGKGAEERHARANEQRYCSSTVGRDGQWRLNAGLTVTDGALVDKVLEYFQTEAFDDARLAGLREPFTAYRADALVRMARAAMENSTAHGHSATTPAGAGEEASQHAGSSSGVESTDMMPRRRRRGRPRKRSSSLRHAIIVTVPHTTFLTGTPTDGETCEIPGIGPVPVAQVQQLLEDDPIIKCIVTRGRDITTTATMTRNLKDDLRLAVLHQHGYVCAVPECTNTRFVELDHELDFAKDGPTAYDNLRPLCRYHHDLRTRLKFELIGEPGCYQWLAPDGTVLAADPGARRSPDPIPPHRADNGSVLPKQPTAEHSPDPHRVPG